MIAGGLLNPVKSRRLLQVPCLHPLSCLQPFAVAYTPLAQILLALNKTNDEIRNAFEGKLKSYLSYKPGSS